MSDRDELKLMRDAIYAFINNMDKYHNDLNHRLDQIASHLEEINGNLSDIAKAMPNPLDHE